MTLFEFVFGFISIITSLALTHLIVGVVGLIRNADRVKFSLAHAAWVFVAFASTLANWAGAWELRSITSFPNWSFLLLVAWTLARYAFCVFVTPEIAAAGPIDLTTFHERERRRYLSAFLVTLMLAQGINFSFGAIIYDAAWLRDSTLVLVTFATVLLALFVRARWAQLLAGAIAVGLYSYYVSLTTNLTG